MIDPLLLTAARILTFEGQRGLTNASGFFFERGERLFVVTSRHVLVDEPSGHRPDRIEIEVHTDADNLARSTGFSMPLYQHGAAVWRQGRDSAGDIDVAVIEVDRSALPDSAVYRAFSPSRLYQPGESIDVGTALLVVGFPMGFHDDLHHLPVVRQAVVASSFGLRFQGKGYFLTDARTHQGTSGAPVVMRTAEPARADGELQWRLLGVHSARIDLGSRDRAVDEALGLNCAWYADIVTTLTAD